MRLLPPLINPRRLSYVSRLSRRDGWHLPWHRHDNDANEGQTNNPPPNGKRSLDDLEERDWDEFERRYWLD